MWSGQADPGKVEIRREHLHGVPIKRVCGQLNANVAALEGRPAGSIRYKQGFARKTAARLLSPAVAFPTLKGWKSS